jgi:hypothetical protein
MTFRPALSLLVTAVGYGVTGILLYRGRVRTDILALDSDTLVFLVPALAAWLCNSAILWQALRPVASGPARLLSAVGVGAVATFVTLWGLMVIALNLYGE